MWVERTGVGVLVLMLPGRLDLQQGDILGPLFPNLSMGQIALPLLTLQSH